MQGDLLKTSMDEENCSAFPKFSLLARRSPNKNNAITLFLKNKSHLHFSALQGGPALTAVGQHSQLLVVCSVLDVHRSRQRIIIARNGLVDLSERVLNDIKK